RGPVQTGALRDLGRGELDHPRPEERTDLTHAGDGTDVRGRRPLLIIVHHAGIVVRMENTGTGRLLSDEEWQPASQFWSSVVPSLKFLAYQSMFCRTVSPVFTGP